MILVDTGIWIDHIKSEDELLGLMLDRDEVLLHPWIIGEIALGSLAKREATLADLQALPRANVADEDEVLQMMTTHRLYGSGIGYIDAHLLASCLLEREVSLWTRDKRLLAAARRLSQDAKLMH